MASSFVEALDPPARTSFKSLIGGKRTEMTRLLRDVGPENFSMHWKEHKQDLAEFEHDFGPL